MKLEVKNDNFLSLDELIPKADLFHLPAVILGSDFKILARNNSFSDSRTLRIGTRFDNFLSKSDRERLYSLEEGKTLVADLFDGKRKGYATVIRGSDCFLVCFRYLSDSMVGHILERMNKLSGYDIGVNTYISAVLADVGATQSGKRLSAVIERLLIELSDVHRLVFFNLAETASAFFSALGELSPALYRRVDMPKSFPESVALGHGDDLLLISAYVLSLCFDCSNGGRVDFSASDCENGIKVCFSCDMEDESSDAVLFTNALYSRESDENSLGRPSFWAFFTGLIADTNLWEISASVNGKFIFSVYIPSVPQGEEFSVRDSEKASLLAMLRFFFSE